MAKKSEVYNNGLSEINYHLHLISTGKLYDPEYDLEEYADCYIPETICTAVRGMKRGRSRRIVFRKRVFLRELEGYIDFYFRRSIGERRMVATGADYVQEPGKSGSKVRLSPSIASWYYEELVEGY